MKRVAVILALLGGMLFPGMSGAAVWEHRGVNLTAWWSYGYGLDDPVGSDQQAYTNNFADNIKRLAADGVNSISLIPTRYMTSCKGGDNQILVTSQTISDQSLLHAAWTIRSIYEQAGKSQPQIVLKPHVDCQDGSARASLKTNDDLAWWENYKAMMIDYASLAQQMGAGLLVIGTELTSRTRAWDRCGKIKCDATYVNNRWWDLIKALRGSVPYRKNGQLQFPQYSGGQVFAGKLTFAADKISGVGAAKFWGGLDYIGLDAYDPLVKDEPAGSKLAAYSAGWKKNLALLDQQSKYYNKPLLLTEAGYPSAPDAGSKPWGADIKTYDGQSQQDAFVALLSILQINPRVAGISVWEWRTGKDPLPDLPLDAILLKASHTFYGKPTEALIQAWFAPPVQTTPGSISFTGILKPGKLLTAQSGRWQAGNSSFVWQRCRAVCQNLPGAASTYRLAAGDVGTRFRLLETASTAAGSLSVLSDYTPLVVR